MAPIRWGICATGRMSSKFMAGLKTLPETDHQVVAVAARSQSAAAQFAETHGISNYFGSYAELSLCAEVDVVYVANIHPKHYDAVMMMFEAGKPVLCEKPLTMNASDTRKLIQAARDKGVFFMEAVWMRFFPAMAELRRQVNEGCLGIVKHIHVTFGFRHEQVPERLARPELGGGAVLDLGVYCINLATMVFGERPVRVEASGSLLETGVDETTAILLSYSGGRIAQLTCSSNLELPKEAVISGTTGSVRVLAPFWCPTHLQAPEGDLEFPLPPTDHGAGLRRSEGLSYEAEAVRECLEKNQKESDVMPLRHTLMVAEVMDEVLQQIHANNKLEVS